MVAGEGIRRLLVRPSYRSAMWILATALLVIAMATGLQTVRDIEKAHPQYAMRAMLIVATMPLQWLLAWRLLRDVQLVLAARVDRRQAERLDRIAVVAYTILGFGYAALGSAMRMLWRVV